MSTTPGTLRFAQISSSPASPPPGYCFIYSKTDNVLYLKDSSGVEVALGSASAITSLTGEATASGPGAAAVTLLNSAVIGKVLTGFSSGPNSTVLATDTILQAIQKLQAQVTAASSVVLAGDVSGPSGSNTVDFVGGETAADIAQSVVDTQAATAANTASTIVERDASGNFSANVITANLTGTASGNEPPIVATTAADYYRGDKTFQPLNKAAVGLSNVDNTSDVNKPVSTAQAAADALVASNAATALNNHITDTSDAHDASAISFDPTGTGLVATEVQAAIAEVQANVTTLSGSIVEDAQDAVGSILTDTANIDFTYNDGIPTISADLTDTAVAPDTYGAADKVAQFEVDQKGRLLNAVDVVIAIPSTQVTDFTEAAQDAFGGALADTDSINLTYNDAGNQITADLKLSSNAESAGFVRITNSIESTGVSGLLSQVEADTPVQIGTSNFVGAANKVARSDHVHSHGNQTSGTLHAAATTSVNGFMSSTDKTKLDDATNLNTASTIVQRDASGNFLAGTITANLTGAASANLLKAGDSMTGYFRTAVVALTDAANINTDAALGNVFTVTIAGNRTFDAPTNPLSDQKITYKIRQDAVGGRIITWDVAFNFGVDLSGVPNSTSANAFDYYGFQYNSVTSKWDCLAISRGY